MTPSLDRHPNVRTSAVGCSVADVRTAQDSGQRSPIFDSTSKFPYSECGHRCVVQVLAVYDLPTEVGLSKDADCPASSHPHRGEAALAHGSEEDEQVERPEARVHADPPSQWFSPTSAANAIEVPIRTRDLKVAGLPLIRTGHLRTIGHSRIVRRFSAPTQEGVSHSAAC